MLIMLIWIMCACYEAKQSKIAACTQCLKLSLNVCLRQKWNKWRHCNWPWPVAKHRCLITCFMVAVVTKTNFCMFCQICSDQSLESEERSLFPCRCFNCRNFFNSIGLERFEKLFGLKEKCDQDERYVWPTDLFDESANLELQDSLLTMYAAMTLFRIVLFVRN